MEEIRIYHSPWRMLLMVLGCLVFVALSILMLNHPKSGFHILVACPLLLCGIEHVKAAHSEERNAKLKQK